MKRFIVSIIILIFISGAFLYPSDTLHIAPCDKVVIDMFGDMICLSQDDGILMRYVDGVLVDQYSGEESSNEPILQEPGKPVLDGADKIYVLDAATNTILGWDRFLNIYSITPIHEDVLSPQAFTVTSEHDWLIYDDFYGQILQIHPGEDFYTSWGNKTVAGEIELYSVDRHVLLFLKDTRILRICDEEGTTLSEFSLPDSLNVKDVFPLGKMMFALACDDGVYSWKPEDASLRYLSDLKHPVHCHTNGTSFVLIDKEGTVITIP